MLGKNVAAAGLAPLAVALRRLFIGADVFCAGGDAQRVRLPKRECVDRSCGPMSTRVAMAIAHRDRFSADRELDRPAKARTVVARYLVHYVPPCLSQCSTDADGRSAPRRA